MEDESQLVIRACRGSISAFEELIDLYEPRINRVLYGLTQDVQLAQDLCPETFLAAYRALPRMQGEQLHFAPWLYRIAVNQARSEWRRRKHVTTISLALKNRYDEDSGDEYAGEWLVYPHRFEDDVVERDQVRRVDTETLIACAQEISASVYQP